MKSRRKKNAITFITPSHNGADRIGSCLRSIRAQKYPQNLIEIVVIDDNSSDNTAEIAKQYGARVYKKSFGDAQVAKRFALDQVRTEYFINADDDHRLVSNNWIEKMITPLENDNKIAASFAKFVVNKNDPPVSRLLSFDPLQRDPIYMPFTPSFDELTIHKGSKYDILQYTQDKQLPTGQCVWRTELFDKPYIKSRKKYMELDILVLFARHGVSHFAYVHTAKTHHVIADSIKTICKKRVRNIRKNYLYQPDKREYTWFSIKNPSDMLKVIIWVIYTYSVLLPLAYGAFLSVKHKDFSGLHYGPLVIAETSVILFEFVRQFVFESRVKKIKFPV